MNVGGRPTIAVLVLAIAGVALPAAGAATRPDDRAGIRGPVAVSSSTALAPSKSAHPTRSSAQAKNSTRRSTNMTAPLGYSRYAVLRNEG